MKVLASIAFCCICWATYAQHVSIELEPFDIQAQHLPVFPGGMGALRQYMDSIEYPPEAIAQHQEGTVELYFVVNDLGDVNVVKLLQSSGYPLLDSTAIEQTEYLDDWAIGFKYDAAVPVTFIMRVNFYLGKK